MKKKKKSVIACIVLFLAGLACCAFYNGLTLREYTLQSDKIQAPFRAVLLADLHSSIYGNNQEALIDLIKAQNPDFILLAGGIYTHGSLSHIVSRGLSNNVRLPRIFNPPEVVVMDFISTE